MATSYSGFLYIFTLRKLSHALLLCSVHLTVFCCSMLLILLHMPPHLTVNMKVKSHTNAAQAQLIDIDIISLQTRPKLRNLKISMEKKNVACGLDSIYWGSAVEQLTWLYHCAAVVYLYLVNKGLVWSAASLEILSEWRLGITSSPDPLGGGHNNHMPPSNPILCIFFSDVN